MFMVRRIDRRAFLGALGCSQIASGAQPFWNRKDSDSWTTDEILQLTTRSPWAVPARLLPKPGRDKGSAQPIEPDIAGGRAGGRGDGPIPIVSVSEVTVVWASAKPLLDALKSHFPADFANHYIISISDLPSKAKALTANLRTKNKESVGSGAIEPTRNATLFAFSKELLPLSVADKEVIFTVEADLFSVRARFDLREMLYRGMLAI